MLFEDEVRAHCTTFHNAECARCREKEFSHIARMKLVDELYSIRMKLVAFGNPRANLPDSTPEELRELGDRVGSVRATLITGGPAL